MGIVSLLLVGRTGNGKSSTGNSILDRKEFKPKGSNSLISTIQDVLAATSTHKEVMVVDGPGIGDCPFDDPEGIKSTLDMVRKARKFFKNGFNALLIVLKYGVRYTKQESDALKMIKSFFGQNVVKNYGVIVMTYGDSFDLDMEDDPMTFEEWCHDQTGDVKTLFEECDYRCVLFNNKAKEETVKVTQYETLMSMVGRIQPKIGPYTDQDFKEAEGDRHQIIVGSKLPELKQKTNTVLDSVYSRLDKGGDVGLDDLEGLEDELDNHREYLHTEAAGAISVENQLLQEVEVAKMTVSSKIDLFKRSQKAAVQTPERIQKEAEQTETRMGRTRQSPQKNVVTESRKGNSNKKIGKNVGREEPESSIDKTRNNNKNDPNKNSCCSII